MSNKQAVTLSGCVDVDGAAPNYQKWSATPPSACAERLAAEGSIEPVDEQIGRLLSEFQKRARCGVDEAMAHIGKNYPSLLKQYRASFLAVA